MIRLIEVETGEWSEGTKWYRRKDTNGYHREDGPALEFKSGTKLWYINNTLHREDGPALLNYDGSRHWFIHGLKHREDGPASEYIEGNVEWFIHGKRIEQFCDLYDIPYTYRDWSLEYKILWKLSNN